jgi:hypothetical protein
VPSHDDSPARPDRGALLYLTRPGIRPRAPQTKKPASPVSRLSNDGAFNERRLRVQIHGGSTARLGRCGFGLGNGSGYAVDGNLNGVVFAGRLDIIMHLRTLTRALAFQRLANLLLILLRLLDSSLRRDDGESIRNLRLCLTSVF